MRSLNFQDFKLWLTGIATIFACLHLILTFKTANSDFFSSALLFWLAIAYLCNQKRNTIQFNSGLFATLFGTLILSLLLIKSSNFIKYDHFLRIFPFFAVSGIGLIASGVRGLRQYWRELLLAIALAPPATFVSLYFDLSILTAKFSAFLLWLLRFEVTRQGVNVILPTGYIEVYYGCSGMSMILQLLGIALTIALVLTTNWKQKLLLCLSAVVIGFFINGLRVALMAVLVASGDWQAFQYWHLGDGSLIFSLIAIALFGCLCYFTVLKTASELNS